MDEIDKLLHQSRMLWRGSEVKNYREKICSLSTGYQVFDDILPENGWPCGALVDLILPWHQQQVLHGIGELSLLMPAMRCLLAQEKWLLWVAPPYIPYAPALEFGGINLDRLVLLPHTISCRDKLWAMEKALRTAACGMVVCWIDNVSMAAGRRLQLAAEQSGAIGVLMQTRMITASVSSLRLKLKPLPLGLLIEIIKVRGASRYLGVELQLYKDTI
ncbi:RecA/RadA recombinase [hydrothermal vent metagenome]|uniref:RecA/RadA recombinase n=1 Tax=hydrothermal vent metagenome TaxID=652676 RepID=A0A3B0ZNE1_9ZZZZ